MIGYLNGQYLPQENIFISPEDRGFLFADELMIVGTTVEVTPVIAVNGETIGSGAPGAVTRKLQDAFKEKMGSDDPNCKLFSSINDFMTDPAHEKRLNF